MKKKLKRLVIKRRKKANTGFYDPRRNRENVIFQYGKLVSLESRNLAPKGASAAWAKKYEMTREEKSEALRHIKEETRDLTPRKDRAGFVMNYARIVKAEKEGSIYRGAAARYKNKYLPRDTKEDLLEEAESYGEPKTKIIDTGSVKAPLVPGMPKLYPSEKRPEPYGSELEVIEAEVDPIVSDAMIRRKMQIVLDAGATDVKTEPIIGIDKRDGKPTVVGTKVKAVVDPKNIQRVKTIFASEFSPDIRLRTVMHAEKGTRTPDPWTQRPVAGYKSTRVHSESVSFLKNAEHIAGSNLTKYERKIIENNKYHASRADAKYRQDTVARHKFYKKITSDLSELRAELQRETMRQFQERATGRQRATVRTRPKVQSVILKVPKINLAFGMRSLSGRR